MSTKGVSVTAARHLVDSICARYAIPLLVLHDFDVAGFMIYGTLQRDTRRYSFTSSFPIIDLGLRLKDIEGLGTEPAAPSKTNEAALRRQLANNGASDAEINMLLTDRVELNAMDSEQLVKFIEDKLEGNGIQKVIPPIELLEKAYRELDRGIQLKKVFDAAEKKIGKSAFTIVPKNLDKKVREVIVEHDDLRWDQALQLVMDPELLDDLRKEKKEEKDKSGKFTDDGMEDDDDDD